MCEPIRADEGGLRSQTDAKGLWVPAKNQIAPLRQEHRIQRRAEQSAGALFQR